MGSSVRSGQRIGQGLGSAQQRRLLSLVLGVVGLGLTGNANAATLTWDNVAANGVANAGNGNWNAVDKWTVDAGTTNQTWSSATPDDAIISTVSTITVDAATTVGSLSFTNTSGTAQISTAGTPQTFTVNGAISKSGAGTAIIDQLITGSSNAISITGGTLQFSVSSTGLGAISIDNGATLQGNGNVQVGTGKITVQSGGGVITRNSGNPNFNNAIDLNGDLTIDNIGTGTMSGAVDLLGGTRTFTTNGTRTEFTGVFSSSVSNATASLVKAGSGAMWIGNNATYGGSTTINAGSISIRGGNNRLPTATDLTIASGASLDMHTQSQQVATLSGAGSVTSTATTAGTSTLTVTGSSTFSGVISNGTSSRVLAITKSTGGKLTLSGANTYTGPTNVTGGTLEVTGSLANTAVSIAAGGTLGGTGTIAGTVSAIGASGNLATIAPGTSVGTLTVNNTVFGGTKEGLDMKGGTRNGVAYGNTTIRLRWLDNSGNETGFRIERSTDQSNWSLITTTAANATTFDNTGLTTGVRYYYRVRANGTGGNSAFVGANTSAVDVKWLANSSGWTNATAGADGSLTTAATTSSLNQNVSYNFGGSSFTLTGINLAFGNSTNRQYTFHVDLHINGNWVRVATSATSNLGPDDVYQTFNFGQSYSNVTRVRITALGNNVDSSFSLEELQVLT